MVPKFLENSSFLVTNYFLVSHEEFKTEKIPQPNSYTTDIVRARAQFCCPFCRCSRMNQECDSKNMHMQCITTTIEANCGMKPWQQPLVVG